MTERLQPKPISPHSDEAIANLIAGNVGDTSDDPLLQAHSNETGRLLLIGHCLANKSEINQALTQAQARSTILPLTELAGSYAGVYSTDQGTTVFTDPAGQFPIHYQQGEDGIALSTSAGHLAAAYHQDIDRVSLAAHVWQGMNYLNEGLSFFQTVRQLSGGEALHLSATGVSKYTYESFAANPEVDFAAAVEMTRDRLTDAVRRRVNTECVTSDFSGGHDSTSLAMLAASLSNRPVPSLVHYNAAYPAGDIKHARRLAQLHPGIDLQELEDGPDEMPYATLDPEAIPFFRDAPFRLADVIGLERKRYQTVLENSSTLHLIGLGGDAVYDGFPVLADLLRRGETDKVWEQAVLLARLSLESSPQQWIESAEREQHMTLAQAYAAVAEICHNPAKRLGFAVGWLHRPTANLQWLTPEMRLLLASRAEAQGEQASRQLTTGEHNTRTSIYSNGNAYAHVRQISGALYHTPFLDHQVIRAATQLDIFERGPIGSFKPLLRAALSGHGVPPEVFERTSKGNYSPVADAGLQRSLGAVLGLLDNSRLAAMGIIDPRAVRRSIEEQGLTTEQTYVEAFVSAELWLRQRELFEATGTVELQPQTIAAPEVTVGPEVAAILSRRYILSPDVTYAAGPVQMMALNLRTGNHFVLNSTAICILQALAKGPTESVVASLSAMFPEVNPIQLRVDAAAAIANFKREGLIADYSPNEAMTTVVLPPWSPGQPDHTPDIENYRVRPLHPTEQFVFSDMEKERGHRVLTQAHKLANQGLAATIQFLKAVAPPDTAPFSTIEAVQRDLVNLRQLSLDSKHNNQRIACYESSLAATLLAAQRGQRLTWNIGVAFRPGPILHAWVEIDDKPITISTDEQVEGVYRHLFRL